MCKWICYFSTRDRQHVENLERNLDIDRMPAWILPAFLSAVPALSCAILLHRRQSAFHTLRVWPICIAGGNIER
jgi:hypothetical protein